MSHCEICGVSPSYEHEVDRFVLVNRCRDCIELKVLPWGVMVGIAANYGPRDTERRFPGAIESTCNFYEADEEFLWGEVEENYKQLDQIRGESA